MKDHIMKFIKDSGWLVPFSPPTYSPVYAPHLDGKWVVEMSEDLFCYFAGQCLYLHLTAYAKYHIEGSVGCFYIRVNDTDLHRQFLHYLASYLPLDMVYYKLDSETKAGVKGRPIAPALTAHSLMEGTQ